MNFQKIRLIDHLVGVPLCFLFTLYRRFKDFLIRPKTNSKPQKLLFLKLIEQGSNILAYDALVTAVERLGKENVFFWIFEENKPVLDLLEVLEPKNIISIRSAPFPLFVWDVLWSIGKIRKLKIDTVVDMEFFARAPALLGYLTGAKRRVGVHRFNSDGPYRGNLLTHRVQYQIYLHTARFFRLLLDAAFEDPKDEPLLKKPVSKDEIKIAKIKTSPDEVERVRNKLLAEKENIFSGPIVILNANASDMIPLRKWDSERYIELGHRVLSQFPQSSIVLTGAPSEQAPIELIAKQFNSNRVVSMAGKTSLREVVILYTLCDVMVTNDSGPGHFASMTDIYSITLFGPETPLLYSALGKNKAALSANLSCTPCVNVYNDRFSPCKNNVCMQEIRVDQVFEEVKKGLAAATQMTEKKAAIQ